VKTRKVIHITRAAKGGVAVVVDQLARGLNRGKYETMVFFESNVQSDIRKKLHESDVMTIDLRKCSEMQNNSFPRIRKNYDISGRLEKKLGDKARQSYMSIKHFQYFLVNQLPRIKIFVKAFKKYKADLIHTHSNLYSCKPEIIAARKLGIPCVSHHHGYAKLPYFDEFFSNFIDKFVYISKDVERYYNSNKKKKMAGKIIHNGIDVNKYKKVHNNSAIRAEFGIQADQPLVGIVGRLDWWKGHEYFLKAIAKSNQTISNLKGLIIGDLENEVAVKRNRLYYAKLKMLITELDLNDKIIFTGYRNDIPRLMSTLDVVVHASSIPEPFGLVIIEGMAAGKPVVATAAGGVLEIIENDVNGVLVPCRDSDAIAKEITKLISKPDVAAHMGKAAKKRVIEKFSIQRQLTAVESLYDSILTNS